MKPKLLTRKELEDRYHDQVFVLKNGLDKNHLIDLLCQCKTPFVQASIMNSVAFEILEQVAKHNH